MRWPAGVLLSWLIAGVAQAGGAFYKWVDEAGHVHYSDSPPLQSQQQGVAELSRQGMIKRPAESPAARHQREAAELAEQQQQRLQAEQRRRDRALLDSYRSVNELRADREKELVTQQTLLTSLQARQRDLTNQLQGLQREADALRRRGATVPPVFMQNSRVLQQELVNNRRQIINKQAEIQTARQNLAQDVQRLQQLTASAAH